MRSACTEAAAACIPGLSVETPTIHKSPLIQNNPKPTTAPAAAAAAAVAAAEKKTVAGASAACRPKHVLALKAVAAAAAAAAVAVAGAAAAAVAVVGSEGIGNWRKGVGPPRAWNVYQSKQLLPGV